MSLFIDRLKRISRTAPRSIGFKAVSSVSATLKMQLVAGLEADGAGQLTGHIIGADAVILSPANLSAGVKALREITKAVSDIPCGVRLLAVPEDIKPLGKAGGDFAVFPSESAVMGLLEGDAPGKIVEVEAAINEGLLRAVNQLPLDAVLVNCEKEGDALTWHHLMLFRRFADLLAIPLLVSIPVTVTTAQLQAIWDAGVSGVVVTVTGEQSQDRIQELRKMIDNLAFPASRVRYREEVRLPRITQPTSTLADAGEEEEEDY